MSLGHCVCIHNLLGARVYMRHLTLHKLDYKCATLIFILNDDGLLLAGTSSIAIRSLAAPQIHLFK